MPASANQRADQGASLWVTKAALTPDDSRIISASVLFWCMTIGRAANAVDELSPPDWHPPRTGVSSSTTAANRRAKKRQASVIFRVSPMVVAIPVTSRETPVCQLGSHKDHPSPLTPEFSKDLGRVWMCPNLGWTPVHDDP